MHSSRFFFFFNIHLALLFYGLTWNWLMLCYQHECLLLSVSLFKEPAKPKDSFWYYFGSDLRYISDSKKKSKKINGFRLQQARSIATFPDTHRLCRASSLLLSWASVKVIGGKYMYHFIKKTLCDTSVSPSGMLLSSFFSITETLQQPFKVQSKIRR